MIPSLDFAVITFTKSGRILISFYEIFEMFFIKNEIISQRLEQRNKGLIKIIIFMGPLTYNTNSEKI